MIHVEQIISLCIPINQLIIQSSFDFDCVSIRYTSVFHLINTKHFCADNIETQSL